MRYNMKFLLSLFWITICILSAGCTAAPQAASGTPPATPVVTEAKVPEATAAPTPAPVSCYNDILWGQQFGSPMDDLTVSLAVDKDGNSCITGYTLGDVFDSAKGGNDILVVRLNTEGKVLWKLQEGTTADDMANYVALDQKGDVFITGYTKGKLQGSIGEGIAFVQKLSADGKIIWTRQFGGSDAIKTNFIGFNTKQEMYIAGTTSGKLGKVSCGSGDAFVSRLDDKGKMLWASQWGCSAYDEVTGVDFDAEGNIYVIGQTSGMLGEQQYGDVDIFVSKLDPSGNIIYTKQYGSSKMETAYKILIDANKDIYLTGSTEGNFAAPQAGKSDNLFLKLSNDGNLLWKKQFGTKQWDGVHDVALSKADPSNVIIGGCQNWPRCQSFLRKYDKDGNELWRKELIMPFSTCGREFGLDDQGFIYQTGGTHGKLFNDFGFQGTEADIFIYKISEK